jgi:hypothetical protein
MALHEASLVLPLSGRAAVLLNLSDPGQLLGNKRLAVAPVRSTPRRRLRGERLSALLRTPARPPNRKGRCHIKQIKANLPVGPSCLSH